MTQVLLMCVGWPTQDKILLANWESDEEAYYLRPDRCCRGSESQRLPPWLPSSHAHDGYVEATSVLAIHLLSVHLLQKKIVLLHESVNDYNAAGQPAMHNASDSNNFMSSPTEELASSVQGASTRWERGQVLDVGAQITPQTRVRILRAGCAR